MSVVWRGFEDGGGEWEYAIASARSSDEGVARDLLKKVLERWFESLEEQVDTIITGSGDSRKSGGSRPCS